ncbi:MAG: DUF2783 domain-containing protein [Chloroflexota bacterium]|nr:DUF2783 domain-containing protein [Chloroflexota bacterium]
MAKLKTDPRIQAPDLFYKALAQLHDGLSAEDSLRVNSKLILLLANHIGDHEVLMEAIERVSANERARADDSQN